MSKKLTQQSFQSLYPETTQEFTRRSVDMLRRLQAQPARHRQGRKLALSLALALTLTLVAFSALAVTLDWNVMDFLFGSREHAAKTLLQEVNLTSSDGQVTLTVNSALTDGETLAMDWTIDNEDPSSPVFVMVDSFTAGDARLVTDGNDEFDCEWLPGAFSNGGMRDGEIIELPQAVRDADALEITLTVGVYRPTQPIFLMDEFDADLAAQKLSEGYLVIPEGEGIAIDDPDFGVIHVFGRIPDGKDESFSRSELALTFTLDLKAARESVRQLHTQPLYASDYFTARYTEATVSPMGLTLRMDIFASDVEYRFELTDENGALLETPWPYGEMTTETDQDGSVCKHLTNIWYGLTQEMLPDVISLSYLPKDGEPAIFPVRVR